MDENAVLLLSEQEVGNPGLMVTQDERGQKMLKYLLNPLTVTDASHCEVTNCKNIFIFNNFSFT